MGEYPCQSCDSAFDSRRGLGVHHSAAHDERLPNRECENCGQRFYAEYEKKYCSTDCRETAVSFAGEDNPNYSGGKTETDCGICGTSFEYYPSDKEGLYCPTCVETEHWQTMPDVDGDSNPRWSGGQLELTCDVCGETVERYPSNVTGEAVLCGEDCQQTWLSESFSGDGHPNWQGGGNGAYGTGWRRVRQQALERDGYQCTVCSKSKREIGRNPDVHHIIPVRVFVESDEHDKTDAHYIENVISLCVDCHRKADFGHISRSELRSLLPSG